MGTVVVFEKLASPRPIYILIINSLRDFMVEPRNRKKKKKVSLLMRENDFIISISWQTLLQKRREKEKQRKNVYSDI